MGTKIFHSGRRGTSIGTDALSWVAGPRAELVRSRDGRAPPDAEAEAGVTAGLEAGGSSTKLCTTARPESESRFSRCRSARRSPAC